MSAANKGGFPFTQVVGQDDAKLALLLLAIDPLIGGVLLRGEKGSAKTTLARGLASLVVADAPFVDLPLGATEDRLIGTLDIAKALVDRELTFNPGLLAEVDGGVLYVDEVNLLADHLVDTLLDVSVSGKNRIERDGLSHEHRSRFVLIGSMNPEEGELRPQLLDRFGLCVDVRTTNDVDERVEAVRRRLDFDSSNSGKNPQGGADASEAGHDDTQRSEAKLRNQLRRARPATIPDTIIQAASALAVAVGVEGLRADLVLCRAAAANAGLDNRLICDEDDLRRVAPLVLAHRSRRNPFDPPMLPSEQIQEALDELLDKPTTDEGRKPDEGLDPEDEAHGEPDHDESRSPEHGGTQDGDSGGATMATGVDRDTPMAERADRLIAKLAESPAGRRHTVEGSRGRTIRDVPAQTSTTRPIAVAGTVRHLALTKPAGEPIAPSDLREAVKEQRAGSLLLLAVDTSGSMGASERAEAATGTALGLLTDAYQRRDHVALITFSGDGAKTILQPTGSVEVARNRLQELPSGGTTPLAQGLAHVQALAQKRRDKSRVPYCVILTDGRANGGPSAWPDALAQAGRFRDAGLRGLVLDCETGVPRLGLAQELAQAMGVDCVSAADLAPASLTKAIRQAVQGADRAS